MRMEEAITEKVTVYIHILLINSTRNVWKTVHVDVNNRGVDRANPKARNLLDIYSAVSIWQHFHKNVW